MQSLWYTHTWSSAAAGHVPAIRPWATGNLNRLNPFLFFLLLLHDGNSSSTWPSSRYLPVQRYKYRYSCSCVGQDGLLVPVGSTSCPTGPVRSGPPMVLGKSQRMHGTGGSCWMGMHVAMCPHSFGLVRIPLCSGLPIQTGPLFITAASFPAAGPCDSNTNC